MPNNADESVVRISKEHPSVTTYDYGGGNRQPEDILDLSPPTSVDYLLKDEQLHIVLELETAGASEIGSDATLRWVAQGPLEEDTTKVTRDYRYAEFSEANQRNAEEKVYFEFVLERKDFPVTITEDGHLKLQMLHDTDVAWTNCTVEFEIYRRSYN